LQKTRSHSRRRVAEQRASVMRPRRAGFAVAHSAFVGAAVFSSPGGSSKKVGGSKACPAALDTADAAGAALGEGGASWAAAGEGALLAAGSGASAEADAAGRGAAGGARSQALSSKASAAARR
jgi:hypothetical protein